MDKVFHAIELAACAHRGQVRKGSGVPYLIHPLNVAKLLIQGGCVEEVVVAGLLHDTVEDTDMELADIEAEFGPGVAALVAGASEPDKTAPLGGAQTAYHRQRAAGAAGGVVDHLRRQARQYPLVAGGSQADRTGVVDAF